MLARVTGYLALPARRVPTYVCGRASVVLDAWVLCEGLIHSLRASEVDRSGRTSPHRSCTIGICSKVREVFLP